MYIPPPPNIATMASNQQTAHIDQLKWLEKNSNVTTNFKNLNNKSQLDLTLKVLYSDKNKRRESRKTREIEYEYDWQATFIFRFLVLNHSSPFMANTSVE